MPVPTRGSAYSTNRGLWGVTIGGTETLDSKGSIPESAWVLSAGALDKPQPSSEIEIEFAQGVPVGLDGKRLDAVALIEKVEELGARYGIGRGIHLGDTIIGTKGRVAFEAPAAEILISAHRELEKLTLLGTQATVKEPVSQVYGQLIHEGKQLDPACRDIEALLAIVAGARHGQGPRAAAARQPVRARRDLAAFADGRQPRQVRRGGRRMDAGRCLRVLEDHGVARHVPHPGRRAVTCARFSSTRSRRSRSQRISAKRSA